MPNNKKKRGREESHASSVLLTLGESVFSSDENSAFQTFTSIKRQKNQITLDQVACYEAIASQDWERVIAYVARGVGLMYMDDEWNSVLHLAVIHKQSTLVSLCLEDYRGPLVENKANQTSLEIALMDPDKHISELLLNHMLENEEATHELIEFAVERNMSSIVIRCLDTLPYTEELIKRLIDRSNELNQPRLESLLLGYLLNEQSILIEFLKILGFVAADDDYFVLGICHGYAYMSVQAILLGELSKFEERLRMLARSYQYDRGVSLKNAINDVRNRCKEGGISVVSDHDYDLLEVLAFFEGMYFYQDPEFHCIDLSIRHNIFNGRKITQNTVESLFPFMLPQRMSESQQSIALTYKFSSISSKKLSDYLDLMKDYFLKIKKRYAVVISDPGHVVALTFYSDGDLFHWKIIDAEQALLDPIAHAFIKEKLMDCFEGDTYEIRIYETIACDHQAKPVFLDRAIEDCDVSAAQLLIKNEAFVLPFKPHVGTLLTYLASLGEFPLINKILDEGIESVNATNYVNESPLLLALIYDHDDVAELLIKYGADVHQESDDGQTPLQLAAELEKVDLVKSMLTGDASKNALFLAVESGCDEAVRLLLETDSSDELGINRPNRFGMTPLMLAAVSGFSSIILLLLDHGADFNYVDDNGDTPLLLSIASKQEEAARVLIESGANVHQSDKVFRSPLTMACEKKMDAIVRLLIEHGAACQEGRLTPCPAVLFPQEPGSPFKDDNRLSLVAPLSPSK